MCDPIGRIMCKKHQEQRGRIGHVGERSNEVSELAREKRKREEREGRRGEHVRRSKGRERRNEQY